MNNIRKIFIPVVVLWPALKISFQNFALESFGVVSEKLKKIAKTPVIPQFFVSKNSTASIESILSIFLLLALIQVL